MRKITLLLAAVAFSIIGAYAQQAKYVFYFIGDGMGVNQVQGIEFFCGVLEGKIGILLYPVPLCNCRNNLFCHQRSD